MMELSESSLPADPLRLFQVWFEEAAASGHPLPEAMTLATATKDGRPSGRIVLLKGYGAEGFRFVTNYASPKAADLEENPRASMTFWWPQLAVQVRVEGAVTRVPESESDEYFATRPRGSQIGAWASEQSSVIESRAVLEQRAAEFTEKFKGQEVPRPPRWGGYRLFHEVIEFWNNRDDRLHDRFLYTREGEGWKVVRLAP